MSNEEVIKRREVYKRVANDFSLLSDDQLSTLLDTAKSMGNSIGGASALLKISNTNIFIKKIRLTDLERLPVNRMSTANLFHLPLYYQYGVGSTGFGAWRELAAHILSTNWVVNDECPNFPILYHWRILPSTRQEPDEEQLVKLDKDVKYWNNSSAIHDRLEANLYASADIVLFLEYFPQNVYQWFGGQITQGESATEIACEMIEKHLFQTISFMKAQNFIHFDAHFHNILTDGNHLYFSDFGLAMSSNFELSEEERNFFKEHIEYDNYSAATNFLHCFVTHYAGKGNWIESLHELINEKIQKLSPQAAFIIERYASTAVLMDKFYRSLQKDKTTKYPVKELERAWDNVIKQSELNIQTNDKNLNKDIIQWGYSYLSSHGYTLKNNLPENVQDTPWSYVIRFATTDGYIYLKQTPRLIALEPIITRILHDRFHASVPDVIAHNSELNCFLMKDAGSPLRQILKKQFDAALLCKGINQFTSLQLDVANHVDILMDADVPDWRLDKLPDLFAQLLSQKDILIADGLSEKEINDLKDLFPKLVNLCKKLSDYSIKQSIVQPDFNDNNLLVDDMLNITLIDLGEIVISHPFFSLINCLKQVKKHHALADNDETALMFAARYNAYDCMEN